jgi:cell fate regulator YaaT (PSP1 superfamily)
MEETQKAFVVGIRFSKVGKIYHFDASHLSDVLVEDRVVVETSRGWQLGEVAQIIGWVKPDENEGWKSVSRKASPADLMKRKSLEAEEDKILDSCRIAVFSRNLSGVKIVAAEYSLDGIRLSILYSIEGDIKADLRFLKQEVNKINRQAQMELRQIGPRDVAKIIAGMGACGLPMRCCSKFLTDFSSISIKMAKEQGISLTPAEITGMCGRLRCCLIYEYSHYHENRKLLPKRNKKVMTPVGEGKVVDVLPLKMAAIVDVPEVGRKEFNHADMIPMAQYLAQQAEKTASQQKEEAQIKDQPTVEQQKDQESQNQNSSGEENQPRQRSNNQQRRGSSRRTGFKKKDSQNTHPNSGGNQQRRRPPNQRNDQNDKKS